MRSWASSSSFVRGLVLSLIGATVLPSCGASGEGKNATVEQPRGPGGGTTNGNQNGVGAPLLPGTPGAPGGGTGPSPTAPTLPGVDGMSFDGLDLGEPPPNMGCQQAQRSFVPKIPTVFILVDRSFSMFDPNPPGSNTNAWGPLRAGVLQVVADLQADVRFGFSAFSGQGATCPDMQVEAPDLNNQTDIATLYNSLDRSMFKDTPTLLALRRASQALWNDTFEGDKYILFVTDGEPDYCDDGNALCPPDSVVGTLQKLALGIDGAGAQQAPIYTLVFGINSPLTTISPAVLQAFANAGAGLPVAPPRPNLTQPYDPNAIYDQCNGVPGWAAEFATTGKPAMRGQTTGTYIDPADPLAAAGTATVYRPDPTDQQALIGQIRAALAGVKSCSFDLTGDVLVDLNRQDLGALAKVIVNGNAVPFDAANGWHMASETTVELTGQACAAWRVPGETSIDFDFPCDVIIVR